MQDSSTRRPLLVSSPGIELDLRGQRAEDALDMLDRYLEKAYMAGLPFVRIIHGKGTGKLRQEVRAALRATRRWSRSRRAVPRKAARA